MEQRTRVELKQLVVPASVHFPLIVKMESTTMPCGYHKIPAGRRMFLSLPWNFKARRDWPFSNPHPCPKPHKICPIRYRLVRKVLLNRATKRIE